MVILKTNQIKKYYGSNENLVKAIDGVSISINHGDFVAIVGTSGSGKSTLLNLLGGLDNPTNGEIIIKGKNIAHLNNNELAIFRRRNIGFIFQNYNLIPVLNVYDNIVLPISFDKINKVDKNYISELLKTLMIEDKIYKFPNQLSGGQKQRVAIARALATKPSIILADEPTGNLDTKTTLEVVSLLKKTSKKFNQTIVMVTHNENIAQICDYVIHIEDGKVISKGMNINEINN